MCKMIAHHNNTVDKWENMDKDITATLNFPVNWGEYHICSNKNWAVDQIVKGTQVLIAPGNLTEAFLYRTPADLSITWGEFCSGGAVSAVTDGKLSLNLVGISS